MRVLFWSGNFWPQIGGAEILATKLLPALRERGYEHIVVAPGISLDQSYELHYRKIPIYRFPFAGVQGRAGLNQMAETRQEIATLKKRFAPDLIHISSITGVDFFHLITANAYPTPLLVTVHGEWDNLAAGPDSLAAHTIRAADWVVGCSEAILKPCRQLVPEIISHSSVIYNGLNLPSLLPKPLPFDPPRLLFLGRLYPDKGVDLALAAFASILHCFPKVPLVIAGDGPERAKLENQVDELGLGDMVEFTGWVNNDNVPSLINSATLVVVPSRKEAFGLSALEAALMARPVVATRVGGLPEVVIHEKTGLLVETDNAAALAEAILTLLKNPEAASRMGQAARSRALEKFNWERYVNSYDALYKKLIEGNLS